MRIGNVLPKTVQHDSFTLSNATVANFQGELKKPIAAIGFLGHSFLDLNCPVGTNPPCPKSSVGLWLSDGGTGGQGLIATPSLGTTQYPVRSYMNAIPVSRIETQAKIVFIAACDTGPVFESLWNIQNGTSGQALIVPIGTDASVIIGHAFSHWEEFVDQLVNGRNNAQDAVTASNTWLLAQGHDISIRSRSKAQTRRRHS